MKILDELKPDFSRDAVFRPGSIQPFGFWDTSLLEQYDSSNTALVSWWAANLSHLAYCPVEKIRILLKGRAELIQFFISQSQLAFAVQVKDTLFIVFQGSCSEEDALLDMKILPIKENGNAIHRGFKYALDCLWPDITDFLSVNIGIKVCFTGHSLGGALAQLASYRAVADSVYTFGSPRVGFKSFTESVTGIHHRFVNCSDLAVWAPPAVMGFRHCGEPVFIDASQNLHFETGVSFRAAERLKNSLKFAAAFKWCNGKNALTRSLIDHAPVNYCRALSRHLLITSA